MAFTENFSNDIENVGAGERYGIGNVELNTTVFEDEIIVGRFAKLDSGSIDKLDGSATPEIAGVVIRNVAASLEDGDTVDAAIYNQIDYMRSGLVTVKVKTGETPALLERVYVSNDGDANDGLATATNTDVAVNAEFIKEMKTDVWLIYITPPQGDVATHIGDATGAHAASAISLLDVGAHTAEIEVEGAIAELYTDIEDHLADAVGAHAASAISLLDIATHTAEIEVEGAIAEIYTQIEDHLADAVAAHAASAISLLDTAGFTTEIEVEAAIAELYPKAPVAIVDPSDAGALTADRSATIALTSTGVVDTRTLAIPSIAGITLLLSFDVDGGDLAVTCAGAINVAGNTVMTFDTAGEYIKLEAATVAGALVWRVIANDGVDLT